MSAGWRVIEALSAHGQDLANYMGAVVAKFWLASS
jgi:hypothetical protein